MKDSGIAAEIEAPRRHIIERPRLTRLLDEADARILMLVAPAGYGKTTLARQWVETAGRLCLWLSATPAFTDPNRLAIRLRDTIYPIIGSAGDHLEDRLRSAPPDQAEPEAIGSFLGSAMDSHDNRLWLVVDDYHHLESEEAERLFDQFVTTSGIQVLLASRRRPRWATARRLIYGEILELGQSALAMNHEEATEVFDGRSAKQLAGLVALADGWPAILGLAANTVAADVPGNAVRESVYDFFADELYLAATAEVREVLAKFALAPSLDADVASRISPGADALLDVAVRLGFLQFEKMTGSYVMHSLLRDFLVRKCRLGADEIEVVVKRLTDHYLEQRLFDDVFVLVRDVPQSEAGRAATNDALAKLLEENRSESLGPWLEHAQNIRLVSPVADLASAEVAFRKGQYKHAELLAAQAAERLPPDSVLKARAWFRAGLSAYHENRSDSALTHHRAALEHALRREERMHAVWGLLTATLELEQDAQPWLDELEAAAVDDPISRVRLANARLGSGYRFGRIREALNDGEAVWPLLERVDDGMVTSAFLNSYAVCLVLAAEYERAIAVVQREMAVIEEYGLTFAVPHALASKIAANVGRRHYAAALRDLEHAERLAERSGDAFSTGNIAANRIKLLLSQGNARAAADCAEEARFPGHLPALRGELLSLHALALAALGESGRSEKLAQAAQRETRAIEANAYATWARVLIARKEHPISIAESVRAAFNSAVETGCMHPVVCAYRVSPELVSDVVGDAELAPPMRDLLWRARDESTGRGAGLAFPRVRTRELSPREAEVLALLGEGLSNRDIGKRLFISEVTAKAHVRHIFEKLGVRSRTEAALMSAVYLDDSDDSV